MGSGGYSRFCHLFLAVLGQVLAAMRGGGVVVPSGAGLVAAPPPGPGEGQAGAGDKPGGVLFREAGRPGGLGDGELDRADAGRARLPGPGGDGRTCAPLTAFT
jgi:hypothetical protein